MSTSEGEDSVAHQSETEIRSCLASGTTSGSDDPDQYRDETTATDFELTEEDVKNLMSIVTEETPVYGIFPIHAKEFLETKEPEVYKSVQHLVNEKKVVVYVSACLKKYFVEKRKPKVHKNILFDICIFSKNQSPSLITFVKGCERKDVIKTYNSSLTREMKSTLMGEMRENFHMFSAVVYTDICGDKDAILDEIAASEKDNQLGSIPNSLHMDDRKLSKVMSNLFEWLQASVLTTSFKEESDIPFESKSRNEVKVFNDPLHGNIQLHPLCVRFIDTPQFQRLRQIKQLGAVQYVYPGATHTRFEHSIGTCYLAGEWARLLSQSLSDDGKIDVSQEDILCVMIAGLCHDLGHGPYSHMFDTYMDKRKTPVLKSMTLEERSVRMLDYLIEDNTLFDSMAHYDLTKDHIDVIKGMIKGQPSFNKDDKDKEKYIKRSKMFLFDIVNNKINGVDVDLWDCLARDCLYLNISNSFDYKRLMLFSRVLIDKDGCTKICFRDKEVENIYKMFETHYDLHRQAYCHRVTHVIHLMLSDALTKAEGKLSIQGSDRELTSVAATVEHMPAFANVTDNFIFNLMSSGGTEESKNIITSFMKRQFYPSFRTTPIKATEAHLRTKMSEKTAELEIRDIVKKESSCVLGKEELVVDFVKIAYNEDETDPTSSIFYFDKSSPTTIVMADANKFQAIRLKPNLFQQYVIVVTCRDVNANSKKRDAIEKALKTWFEKKGVNATKSK